MKSLTTTLIKKITSVVIFSIIAFSAWAISLDDAKNKGLVGEMNNGYLGVIVNSIEVNSLVENVNEKRKSIYMDLARKNHISMDQMTVLAGKKVIDKTKVGHFIQNQSGQWVKK